MLMYFYKMIIVWFIWPRKINLLRCLDSLMSLFLKSIEKFDPYAQNNNQVFDQNPRSMCFAPLFFDINFLQNVVSCSTPDHVANFKLLTSLSE